MNEQLCYTEITKKIWNYLKKFWKSKKVSEKYKKVYIRRFKKYKKF